MPKSHTDPRPEYQRVAADLRAQIMTGALPAGTKLPSTQQLINEYKVANSTVQRALGSLKDEGYLRGEQGRGVFVRAREMITIEAGPYLAPEPRSYSYKLLGVTETQPPHDIVEALRLEEGESAVLRHRLMSLNGEPLELSWSYYPTKIAAGTALASRVKIKDGAPAVLTELGHPQRRMVDRLSVRPPTTAEFEALELPDDIPVIRQLRVVYSDHGLPVEASILVKGGHLHQLLYRQDL